MCLFPSASHPNLSARFVIAAFTSPNAKAVSVSVGLGLLLVLASGGVTTAVAQTNSSVPTSDPASESSVAQQLLFVNPIVGHDHNGDGSQRSPFRSITRALQTAHPNTVIMLAPGTYSEDSGEVFPLVMTSGVTIQGDISTQGRGIVIRGGGTFLSPTSAGQNIAILGANDAALIGVTVTNPNPRGYGVWVESSNPTITGNTLTGNTHDGISTVGNSAPLIQDNRFANNGANGITIFGSSQPEVRENVFEQTGFAINVAENAAPLIVDNSIRQNKIGVLVQENAHPVLRGNVIETNQQDGVTAIAHAQPNLGTSTDPGNNTIRNNQQLDINVNATDQVVPAFGNQLATNRLAGNVDLTGTTALVNPVAANPVAQTIDQTIDRSIDQSTAATITRSPNSVQSAQGGQSTLSSSASQPTSTQSLSSQSASSQSASSQIATHPPASNRTASNTSTTSPITALPPSPSARPSESTPSPHTAQARIPQTAISSVPTQTASVRSSASSSASSNSASVQASPVPVSVVSLPGSSVLPAHLLPANRSSSNRSSSNSLPSNQNITVPPPAESTNRAVSVSSASSASSAPSASSAVQPITQSIHRPVTRPATQPATQPAAIDIPVPPPESARQQTSVPVVAAPQSLPPSIPQSAIITAPSPTPSVPQSAPSRTVTASVTRPVVNASPDPAIQLAAAPRSASSQGAVYPASAPRPTASQPVSAFHAPINIPVPPPETSTTVAIANRSLSSSPSGSSSGTPPSQDLLPVPDGDVPVGNIGDLPTVAVSQNFAYLASAGSSFNSITRANLRYRVVVDAEDEQSQSLVQSIVPSAFWTSIGGRDLMQVGAFSDRTNAEEAVQLMSRSGLRAVIQEIE